MGAEFRRDNHYVPRSYLKRWSLDGSVVPTYRILVQHPNVPLWRAHSLRGIGYHEHLYTRMSVSGESDAIERWLDSEFEAPAEVAIERVLGDRRLSRDDWTSLVRFFAAQDVRTPARLMENLTRWSSTLPSILKETLSSSIAALEQMSPAEREQRMQEAPSHGDVPFRVSLHRDAENGGGWVKGETVVGRGLWLWSIQHLLTKTVQSLSQHRWTVLTPPDGVTWFTSDAPTIRLNYNSPFDYNFGGGWGSVGTDLMLPLGPRHLLYTQVGKAVPSRGRKLDPERAALVQRVIAENAHRFIFAREPSSLVAALRPRVVDASAVKREAEQWADWHRSQSEVERDLLSLPPTPVT